MATFEVMLLDHYTIQDSSKRLELISRLRILADIPHDELSDQELSTFLFNGARVFNPDLETWSEIEFIEEFGIVLWAAMAVTDHRMMASAKYFPIDSRVGKTDPSVRVRNNIEIKKQLRQQFTDYLDDNGISLGDDGIMQGELIRRDYVRDISIPDDTQKAPLKTVVSRLKNTDTTIDIQWLKSDIQDFLRYIIYLDTSPDLEDPTTIGQNLNDDNKAGMREDVTKVATVNNQWENAARITGLASITNYWIVVAVEDLNGRLSFSNEIRVTTD